MSLFLVPSPRRITPSDEHIVLVSPLNYFLIFILLSVSAQYFTHTYAGVHFFSIYCSFIKIPYSVWMSFYLFLSKFRLTYFWPWMALTIHFVLFSWVFGRLLCSCLWAPLIRYTFQHILQQYKYSISIQMGRKTATTRWARWDHAVFACIVFDFYSWWPMFHYAGLLTIYLTGMNSSWNNRSISRSMTKELARGKKLIVIERLSIQYMPVYIVYRKVSL